MMKLDENHLEILNEVMKFTADLVIKKWSEDVMQSLVQGVLYVYNMSVKGDIAEFGTMSARSAVAIATAMKLQNIKYQNLPDRLKSAFFFDSFEGLPEARFEIDKLAPHVSSGTWAKGTCNGLNEKEFNTVINHILPTERYSVMKGWFKDSVPTLDSDIKFAMIHVDGDLYESAIDVLDTLFRRGQISEGAVLFFDDWNCNAACPHFGERRAWSEIVGKYRVAYSDCGDYGVASHKLIVHSYS